MKFQLKFKNNDESIGKEKLFDKRSVRELEFVNFYNLNNTIFFGLDSIIGISKQIYQLYDLLVGKKERVVLVLGIKGSGKTTLV